MNENPENNTEVTEPVTREGILAALKEAFNEGKIRKGDLRQMRAELGVTQAYFTRKQVPAAKRKAKRKAQRVARRANR